MDKKSQNNEDEEILTIPSCSLNLEEKEKVLCDFIIKEKLGEGTFGKVRLGINRQTNETVAIKILDKKRIVKERDKKRLEREINILKSLRHPNIVFLYCDIHTNSNIYLIMEYIKGTELLNYISSNSKLSEEEACFYFRQIISSIEYLHKLKIAHRDIKPENMIIENSTKIIKLVDFGLSNYYNNKNELLSSACGSPSYEAPEMLSGKKYGAAPVDVWSCGIVLYAMICGYLPFEDYDNNILYEKIKEGRFKIPTHVSEIAKDLIKNILNVNPKKRYTLEQIKKHKWFKLCLDNEEYRNKKSLYEGLLLKNYVVPLDEDIIKQTKKDYDIDKEKIRMLLLKNEHNDITTIYYLILLKKSKLGIESIADLKGNSFKKFLSDKNNLLINYDNDINKAIEKINQMNKDKELEETNNIEINNTNKNELEKEQENNINIENNIKHEEENNIMNNDKIEIKDVNYKEDNKKLNQNLKTKDEIKKINKTKIINKVNKNKILTPEKIQKRKKFLNINKEKENKMYSAIKRSYQPKLNIKSFNENKNLIQNNIPKIKDETKSKKNNIKTLEQNKDKNNTTKLNEINRNTNTEKSDIENKKDKNKYNEIKENLNLNKDKMHKTYKPNHLHFKTIENKNILKTADKKNKEIIIKKIDENKMSKSINKRKKFKIGENKNDIINNNKNNSKFERNKTPIYKGGNCLSARLRKNKKLTYMPNKDKKEISKKEKKDK